MKHCLFLLIILFTSRCTTAQETDSLIRVRNSIIGLRFSQHDKTMGMSKIARIMQSNPEAYRYIKSARTNKTVAQVAFLASNVFFWALLNDFYLLDKPHPEYYIASLATSITSLVTIIRSKNQAERAVEKYNEGIKKTTYKPILHLGLKGTALSVAVNF